MFHLATIAVNLILSNSAIRENLNEWILRGSKIEADLPTKPSSMKKTKISEHLTQIAEFKARTAVTQAPSMTLEELQAYASERGENVIYFDIIGLRVSFLYLIYTTSLMIRHRQR